MYISRIVIRNFRNFSHLDVNLRPGATCVIGENNTGKTNLFHAIRLVIDSNLSSVYRQLIEQDIYSVISLANPSQVIASVEFSDFQARPNETALVGTWGVADDLARLSYRFRPKHNVREDIESGERENDLTLEDYHWELTGGGENDPATVDWNEDLGASVRFGDMQQFQVVFLQAVRDVNQDLRRERFSPLRRLFSLSDVPEEERDDLVEIIRDANTEVANSPTIRNTGEDIQNAYSRTAGEAFDLEVTIGMADPSFASISRALTLLLSNGALRDFDTSRNGLGLNNVLYISMLLEYFERRVTNPNTAGQLLLIEEPEAHLHPQLQRVLYSSLRSKQFQTIVSTHSTHISSQSSLESVIVLTNTGNPESASTVPVNDAGLEEQEVADLQRYLDATRSTLLFARKVILVEGPAELFLIPALVKRIMGIDFDRLGISVIPIYGTHFGVYSKLFSADVLPKKCAIIADGDLAPGEVIPDHPNEDAAPVAPNLANLGNDHVHVFQCATTFEREVTLFGNLLFLAEAAEECGAPIIAGRLRQGFAMIEAGRLDANGAQEHLNNLQQSVLNTAKRFGKARFAQIASKHVSSANEIPDYIRDAVTWVIK